MVVNEATKITARRLIPTPPVRNQWQQERTNAAVLKWNLPTT